MPVIRSLKASSTTSALNSALDLRMLSFNQACCPCFGVGGLFYCCVIIGECHSIIKVDTAPAYVTLIFTKTQKKTHLFFKKIVFGFREIGNRGRCSIATKALRLSKISMSPYYSTFSQDIQYPNLQISRYFTTSISSAPF